MNNLTRKHLIIERLQEKFTPTHLEIQDDSHKHIGHAGSKDGAGHFSVTISADCFKNKSRIETHREIYKALDDLIPHEIHALQIMIK